MFLFVCLVITGCTSPRVTQEQINISIDVDNKELKTTIPAGSTVREALKYAQISLGELDQVAPSLNDIIIHTLMIKVTRVKEEFYTRTQQIPFEQQEIISEMLPSGERRLSQAGINGLEEITYHRVFEDGVVASNNIYKSEVLISPLPEVEMIGNQSSYTELSIPGKIAYLSAGNAWVIEGNTSNRRLAISTGDLDGRIFSLSSDGKYLLFTRNSNEAYLINTLWMAKLQDDPAKLIDLGVKNVIQFAQFNHTSDKIAYSTVDWREASPGWQANNDLLILSFDQDGNLSQPKVVIEANSGSVYGWWGMDFSWSPDSKQLSYSRPDGIGIVNLIDSSVSPIQKFDAYQTGGNWAWLPGTAWSPDGTTIYSIQHTLSTSSIDENNEDFDLISIPLKSSKALNLLKRVGMFAYPVPSPIRLFSNFLKDSQLTIINQYDYSLAYLQAIFPLKSEESSYKLCIIDRDGSNPKILFPANDEFGIEPQRISWSPEPINSQGEFMIAFTYNGNIWLVNTNSGVAQQVTGDGLTSHLDWR